MIIDANDGWRNWNKEKQLSKSIENRGIGDRR